MPKKKRWGKTYEDKRDWKSYNEHLIKRGEYYVNPKFLDTWLDEIEQMNAGKIGQPYLYPDSMINFLAVLSPKFDYRSLEGIMRAFAKRLGPFPVICYSQIRKRVKKIELCFAPKGNNLCVGGDGSGIKVTNRGEWIKEKHEGEARGWIKVVILGDDKGNIIDIRIGNDKLDENASSRGMVRKNKESIDKFMGDGLYDAKDNFRLLDHLGIEPVIKIRKGAVPNSGGCMARKKQVLEYQKLGYKDWAKEKKYGRRWVATEGIFSAVKRILGESVRSHKKRDMYLEAKRKFWVYQKLRDLKDT